MSGPPTARVGEESNSLTPEVDELCHGLLRRSSVVRIAARKNSRPRKIRLERRY